MDQNSGRQRTVYPPRRPCLLDGHCSPCNLMTWRNHPQRSGVLEIRISFPNQEGKGNEDTSLGGSSALSDTLSSSSLISTSLPLKSDPGEGAPGRASCQMAGKGSSSASRWNSSSLKASSSIAASLKRSQSSAVRSGQCGLTFELWEPELDSRMAEEAGVAGEALGST